MRRLAVDTVVHDELAPDHLAGLRRLFGDERIPELLLGPVSAWRLASDGPITVTSAASRIIPSTASGHGTSHCAAEAGDAIELAGSPTSTESRSSPSRSRV